MNIIVAIIALVVCVSAVTAYVVASRTKSTLAKVETALSLTRSKLEMVEIVAEIGFWEVDVATSVVSWSEQVFHIHARSPNHGPPALEDAIGYYHPDDQSMVAHSVEKAITEGEDFDFEARIIDDTGQTRHVISRGTSRFAGGRVSGIFGVFIEMNAPVVRP